MKINQRIKVIGGQFVGKKGIIKEKAHGVGSQANKDVWWVKFNDRLIGIVPESQLEVDS